MCQGLCSNLGKLLGKYSAILATQIQVDILTVTMPVALAMATKLTSGLTGTFPISDYEDSQSKCSPSPCMLSSIIILALAKYIDCFITTTELPTLFQIFIKIIRIDSTPHLSILSFGKMYSIGIEHYVQFIS